MPWKARVEDSIVGRLLSRYSLLRCRAHGGISPPNMCTEETQLVSIYAVLTYILITFPRNAYHSTGFSKNSLVDDNVLQSLGVLRSSCSLLISVVCIPALPKPSRLKELFGSLLSYNCPNYSQRTKTCFGSAMILMSWSDTFYLHPLRVTFVTFTGISIGS